MAVHERFRQKAFLYREANVLLALLAWAQKDPLFERPLWEYERILFAQSPETPSSAVRLQAIKTAMADLDALMKEDKRQLTWGRQWFAGLGYDETNPVTLTLFAVHWLHHSSAVHGALKELRAGGRS
jgi:hypothetical protein